MVPMPAPPPIGGNGSAKHDPEIQASDAPRPPRVVCMGIKQDDQKRLEALLNGKVRLSFWTDGAYSSLKDKARSADFVIAMMGMCSHDAVSTANSASAGKVQRIPGHAVERAREAVESWLNRRAS